MYDSGGKRRNDHRKASPRVGARQHGMGPKKATAHRYGRQELEAKKEQYTAGVRERDTINNAGSMIELSSSIRAIDKKKRTLISIFEHLVLKVLPRDHFTTSTENQIDTPRIHLHQTASQARIQV